MNTRQVAQFANREKAMAIEILNAVLENGVPADFEESGMEIEFNPCSGYVYLVNDASQIAMLDENTKRLESWYELPSGEYNGFYEELVSHLLADCITDPEDIEYITDLAEAREDKEIIIKCAQLLGEAVQ